MDCNENSCELANKAQVLLSWMWLPDDVTWISVVQWTRDWVCVDKIYLWYNNWQVSTVYSDWWSLEEDCEWNPLPRECWIPKDYEHQILVRCAPDGTIVFVEHYWIDWVKQPVIYTDWTTWLEWTWDPATLEKCDDVEREAELVPICINGTENWYAIIPFENWVHLDPIAFKDNKLVTIPEPANRSTEHCEVKVNIISWERIAGAWPLTFAKPTWSCYAIWQVIEWTVIMTVDWSVPVEWANWYHEGCKFILESCEEILAFSAIWSATYPPKIYITYYDWVVNTGWF